MRPSTFSHAALAATVSTLASAQSNYILKDDLSYNNFFQNFDFYSGPDPTNGFVQYQTKDAATQKQLVGSFADKQSIFLGVDYKEKDPKGRASVRVESTKSWNKGLLIADIRHMPDSTCGTWPAYWLLGQQNVGTDDWPKGGEIDLLEGVNMDSAAAVTLHTSAGCSVDNATSGLQTRAEAAFMGSMSTSNCDVAAKDQAKNVGCSIKAPQPTAKNGLATYGTDFNNAGGGVYAMEWTDTSISVWFLPRNSSTSAAASSDSTQAPDPSTFGTPLAKFQGQGCDFEERFKNMRIIFDTTFCGDWAGKEWEKSTCAAKTGAKTCEEYVQNNPQAFADSYWEIGGLKWFEKQGGAGSPVASSAPAASATQVSSSLAVVPSSASSLSPVSSLVPVPSGPLSSLVPVPSGPLSSLIPVPSGPLSSPNAALNPVSSAAVPASSSTAGAASSAAAAPPAAGNGTGSGSGGGSSPNMAGFIWPTAHVGGRPAGSPSQGASSPAASSPAASTPVASGPAASSVPAVSQSPAVSSAVASVPGASSVIASAPPASAPPASAPPASAPAASAPIASAPAASSTPLLNAPTQAANPVASSNPAAPATPSDAAPPAASLPAATPSEAAPPAGGATPPAGSQPAATPSPSSANPPAASAPEATPLPATGSAVPSSGASSSSGAAAAPSSAASGTASSAAPSPTTGTGSGSGSASGSGGSSPNMKGFIWPTKHIGSKRAAAEAAALGGVKRRGRTFRW